MQRNGLSERIGAATMDDSYAMYCLTDPNFYDSAVLEVADDAAQGQQ